MNDNVKKENVVRNLLVVMYDKVSDVYSAPYLFLNDASAKRWFSNIYNTKVKPISDNISDYELYKVGEYSTSDGIVKALHKPLLIMKGNDILLFQKVSAGEALEGD